MQTNKDLLDEKMQQEVEFDEVITYLINMQEKFLDEDAKSLGIKTIWVNNYDEDIINILQEIRVIEPE